MAVSNTDQRVLQEIQQAYGGILADQRPAREAWKHSYQLVWTEGMVATLLSLIIPHLQLKRQQAIVAFQFIRHLRSLRRNGRGPARLSDEVVRFRESLYQRMRKLNARGSATGETAEKYSGARL